MIYELYCKNTFDHKDEYDACGTLYIPPQISVSLNNLFELIFNIISLTSEYSTLVAVIIELIRRRSEGGARL